MSEKMKGELKSAIEAMKSTVMRGEQKLNREVHVDYLNQTIQHIGQAILHFETGQPWLYFYVIHSLRVLQKPLSAIFLKDIVQGLYFCLRRDKTMNQYLKQEIFFKEQFRHTSERQEQGNKEQSEEKKQAIIESNKQQKIECKGITNQSIQQMMQSNMGIKKTQLSEKESNTDELIKQECQRKEQQQCVGDSKNPILGAFGGGWNQLQHIASTYSGFLAVLQIGPSAYHLLNREALQSFFFKCKRGGRFIMHEEGQSDLRGSFIVVLITKLLGLDIHLLEGVGEEVSRCQTYEGGIANIEGGQAHGGFTYCGVAALFLLKQLHLLNLGRLTLWLVQRQGQFGAFNGRTNKLFDSCYSFWVGSIFSMLDHYFGGEFSQMGPKGGQECSMKEGEGKTESSNTNQQLKECTKEKIKREGEFRRGRSQLFEERELQQYILLHCQGRGFRDKPGKNEDVYHTCYSLSGYSCSQDGDSKDQIESVCSSRNNTVEAVHPAINVTLPQLRLF